jgi:hypothetical protein
MTACDRPVTASNPVPVLTAALVRRLSNEFACREPIVEGGRLGADERRERLAVQIRLEIVDDFFRPVDPDAPHVLAPDAPALRDERARTDDLAIKLRESILRVVRRDYAGA